MNYAAGAAAVDPNNRAGYSRQSEAMSPDRGSGRSGARELPGPSSADALIGSPGDSEQASCAGPDELWTWFHQRFNDVFTSVLHAFNAVPDADGVARVPADELRCLFTMTERDKLLGYFLTDEIPERLFNDGPVGGTSAQQRILLASHILTNGRYDPASETARIHARMCGHWVEIVNSYAGAVTADASGVIDSYDHDGNVVLGQGEDDVQHEARKNRSGPGVGRENWIPLPIDDFDSLNAGDWLYMCNDNGTGGGNHSVVFNSWVDTAPVGRGRARHRTANCFSQWSPERGGEEHTVKFGEALVPGRRIYPITRVRRVPENTRPATTVAELLPRMGEGDVGRRNARFVGRQSSRRHGPVDIERLIDWLMTTNAAMVGALSNRLDEHQATLLADANDDRELEQLIRLNERLTRLKRGDSALDRTAERDGQDAEHRGYRTAHGRISRDELYGMRNGSIRTIRRGTTGLLQNVRPLPPWSDLRDAG